MQIIVYLLSKFFLGFIYSVLFILIYYFSINLNLLPKNFTDLIHFYDYAGSISFIFIIFIPIILIPNLNLILSRFYQNKKIHHNLLLINFLFIFLLPISLLKLINISFTDPIIINILIVQLISIIISIFIYLHSIKNN